MAKHTAATTSHFLTLRALPHLHSSNHSQPHLVVSSLLLSPLHHSSLINTTGLPDTSSSPTRLQLQLLPEGQGGPALSLADAVDKLRGTRPDPEAEGLWLLKVIFLCLKRFKQSMGRMLHSCTLHCIAPFFPFPVFSHNPHLYTHLPLHPHPHHPQPTLQKTNTT